MIKICAIVLTLATYQQCDDRIPYPDSDDFGSDTEEDEIEPEIEDIEDQCRGDLMIGSYDGLQWIEHCEIYRGSLTIIGSDDFADVHLPHLQTVTGGLTISNVDNFQTGI